MSVKNMRLLRLWLAMTPWVVALVFASLSFASEKPVPDKNTQGQVWINAVGQAIRDDK